MNKYNPNFSTCIGPSMFPTLKNGDALIVKKVSYAQLKAGDIIVYSNSESMTNIVHRIIKKIPDKVITRGDNNSHIDKHPIPASDIIGIITAVKRKDKILKISGGMVGLLNHKIMLIRKQTMPFILFLPRASVNLLTAMHILYFLHRFMKIKIIYIKRNDKIEEIIQYKNRAIGKRHKNEPWHIRSPYKLFINPEKLP